MIAIIDYGLGNVKAFANIFASLDRPYVIATQPAQLSGASRAILPGVGAFDQAIKRLRASGMRDALDELVLQRKLPVLGVCVGMQILVGSSEEGKERGLEWVDGEVVRFDAVIDGKALRVPHMGWNEIQPVRDVDLFFNLEAGSLFYFLHSYLVRCQRAEDVLAVTTYGERFSCALQRDNIYGVQFHPEKSHRSGIQLLKNFADL